ncbi:MAG: hypothetical protein JOY82_08110 [Streptosporangiaceae bacterium]|nr:hypothetical protein [Streptosporangiaceae bacterium]MBV9854477.1 hypothetical protein [Streptosporangiaceae bacterium]
MTVSDDPFESAARHEHAGQLRREAAAAAVRSSPGTVSGSRGMLIAIVVFLGPYVPWAVARAGNHAWTTPTAGRAIVSFFSGTGLPFAACTGWLLVLVWVWAIVAASIPSARRKR